MEIDVPDLGEPDGEAGRYRQRADRAMAFWSIGDKGRAVLEMQAALGEMPGHAEGWHTLGEFLEVLSAEAQSEGDRDQAEMLRGRAITALRKAVQIAPEMAKSHHALGNLYWAEDFRRALAEYESASALDPQYQAARDVAAQIVSECVYRLGTLNVVELDSLKETPSPGMLGAEFYIEEPPIASAVLHTAASIDGEQWIRGWLYTEAQPNLRNDRPAAELAVSASGATSLTKGCPPNYESVRDALLDGGPPPPEEAPAVREGEPTAPVEVLILEAVASQQPARGRAPHEAPSRSQQAASRPPQQPRRSVAALLSLALHEGSTQAARRVDRWLSGAVAGIAIVGAVYFVMAEFRKAPPSQSVASSEGAGVVSRAIKSGGPAVSGSGQAEGAAAEAASTGGEAASSTSQAPGSGGQVASSTAQASSSGAQAVNVAVRAAPERPPVLATASYSPSPSASALAAPAPTASASATSRARTASPPPANRHAAAKMRSGKAVYAQSCMSCHATGVSGSPRLDDFDAWGPKFNRSRVSLYASVFNGKGAMPPRGGDSSLRDLEIKRAVDYMVADAGRIARNTAIDIPPAAPSEPTAPEPALPAAVAPAVSVPARPAWLSALRADLERCRTGSFVEQVACTEQAKWHHCAPDRWATVPECAVGKAGAAP